MSKCRCKKCGKFIKEKEIFYDSKDTYCGDCALKIMVEKYGWTEDRAYHHLEQIQFGNGIRW